MKNSITRSIAVTGSLLLATGLVAVEVSAAGFQVSETSVSALGRAFAGAGISAEGPSDMFHNPAGLMLSSGREMEFGLHSIHPNAEFKDDGSILPSSVPPGHESNGGTTALVPNFFYATNRGADLRYGIGLTSPFGLTTEYDPNWIGRYHAIKSELITVELNPTMAMRVNENLSLGGGITLIKAEAELSQAQFTGTPTDGRATVEGDDIAFGFNLGIVAGDENARLGFGYRSKVDLHITGKLYSSQPTGANANLTLPATAYLSGFKKLNDKFDVLATIRWTDWSTFKELRIDFDEIPPPILPGVLTPFPPPAIKKYNWKDSNTYSIGVNYRPNQRWTLRGGYARDESPIAKDEFRTPRIPDGDRDWLTLGGSYQASAKTRIDFAFAHLFTDAARVNQDADLLPTENPPTSKLKGTYEDTEANIFAIQLHYKLGAAK